MKARRFAFGGVALLVASIACVAAAAPQPASRAASTARTPIERTADAISELRLDEAQHLLEQLALAQANAPEVLFEQGRLRFYLGDYAGAVALADRALPGANAQQRKGWQSMRDLMAATLDVTQGFERKVSGDGRYVVRFPPGKDAVLADYALEVLGRADHALQRTFGVSLPGPLRVEIYASPQTLAQVSALTVEQIETTGTVALSKWNRLMVTSPKALVRGYPWADTITHELVHLVVSRATGDRAPVWLQEGTAKLFERSWRERDPGMELDPGGRALLADATAKGKLLTFEQMHPSIAMLPSEDDAALAFAQVATFMQRYVERYGLDKLREAFVSIKNGMDAREALSKAAAVPFAKLESEWRASLPTKSDGPLLHRLKRRFRRGDGPSDESAEVTESEARRLLRIGDLLWDRGRASAAAKEYEKAHHADGLDPIVAARFGRAALQAGNAQAAAEALTPQVRSYPSHEPSQALLGAARLQLGERQAARDALSEAIWLNPFDPQPHCDLARASDDPAQAKREQLACDALR
ncbi:MAG: peptidase MA family metallohydrolase [Polyangiales bacterium]